MPTPAQLLDAKAFSVNELLFNDALRRAVLFEGLKKTEAARVVAYANQHIFPGVLTRVERLAADVRDLGPVERLRPSRIKAAKDLDEYLRTTVAQQYKGLAASQKERLAALGLSEAQFAADSLRTHLPATLSVGIQTPGLPAMRAIVSGIPVEGKRIGQWYEDLAPALRDRVNRTLHAGILNGEGTDQLIRRVRGTQARGFRDGALQVSRHQAAVVARSTMTHVSAQARELTARENANVVKGVQWVSTLDARTTDICIALDGQEFEIDKGPRPPGHHQCRSTVTFVTKSWQELGLSDVKAKTTPAERASMNGVVAAKTNYGQWLRKQPREFQDAVLGPSRARLWRGNKIRIEQLVTADLRPRTLAELRSLKPGATRFPGLLGGTGPKPKPKPKPKPPPKPEPPTPPPPPAKPKARASKRKALGLSPEAQFERLEARLLGWQERVRRSAADSQAWRILDKTALEEAWRRFAAREVAILMRGNLTEVRARFAYLFRDATKRWSSMTRADLEDYARSGFRLQARRIFDNTGSVWARAALDPDGPGDHFASYVLGNYRRRQELATIRGARRIEKTLKLPEYAPEPGFSTVVLGDRDRFRGLADAAEALTAETAGAAERRAFQDAWNAIAKDREESLRLIARLISPDAARRASTLEGSFAISDPFLYDPRSPLTQKIRQALRELADEGGLRIQARIRKEALPAKEAIAAAREELAEVGITAEVIASRPAAARRVLLDVLRRKNGLQNVAPEALRVREAVAEALPQPFLADARAKLGDVVDAMHPSRITPEVERISYAHRRGQRAYATRAGDVVVDGVIDKRDDVLTHEFGHHIEFNTPSIEARSNAFREARLLESDPSFNAEPWRALHRQGVESYPKDRFFDDYVGRVYSDQSTEVTSMGVQCFADDGYLRRAAATDWDFFALTWATLRGF